MGNSCTICEKLGYIGIMWEIGKRLRKRREAIKLSLGQVEEYEEGYPSTTASVLSMLERGERQPNWELLARLARRYNTSADYILGLTDNPAPVSQNELPPGAAEILGYLSSMSDRGSQQLLRIARTIYEDDQEFQEREEKAKTAELFMSDTDFATVKNMLPAMVTKGLSREEIARHIFNALGNQFGHDNV